MAKIKRYKSKRWLKRKLYRENKTIEEIAKICDVSHMTIRRAADNFNLRY